jgi:hypothetical protein
MTDRNAAARSTSAGLALQVGDDLHSTFDVLAGSLLGV